jgi:hypothetical protein
MMRYPLLTRTSESEQVYLRGLHFRISSSEKTERQRIMEDNLIAKISAEFHIDSSVVRRAVLILKEGGEHLGRAPTS